MKKLIAILLALVLVLSLVACSKPADEPVAEGYQIALITDLGTIDDKSFNQGAWEGVVAYADANDKTYKYYQPTEQSTDAYLSQIEIAVENGAEIIVTPGFLFEEPVFIAQEQYPDVAFILLDGDPHNADYTSYVTGPKTVGVHYAEQEAGYLAGYATVKDGYTKLGFMGGVALPAVIRFGYGFLQGANDAAVEMNTTVEVSYNYTGLFVPDPAIQSMATAWYEAGVEVIFASGGGIYSSICSAAEAANGKVIGVDRDQSAESATIITSAMKSLAPSVESLLGQFYAGSFPGGQSLIFNASTNSVGLPMETSLFTTFSAADYDALYAAISAGEVAIPVETDGALPSDLTTLPNVVLNYVAG